MNVESVDPVLCSAVSHRAPLASRSPVNGGGAWATRVLARLDEKLRYRRAPRKLHQLDDREFDDLALAPAAPALTWAMKGLEALARS